MYQNQDLSKGLTRMELLPISAPVYGGGLIVTFLPEDFLLSDNIRAFLVFKGSKQRQVTEAKISLEDNAFHAVIPDHEPPEPVVLSAYIQFPNGKYHCIGAEEFTYYLDQTCYLARYLADSVHDLDSLEDWDNIQGDNFSLEHEDFATLDERLTSAFQHLILPSDWNLLGDPGQEHIPRETLFHFGSRLGLSTFVTLLLEKNGAEDCLQLENRHGELAKDIAEERGFNGLADLFKDPHAHGVIKWESKEQIGQTIILKRHSFGTVSTTAEPLNNMWPPLDEEIGALSRNSAPPATPIPYKLDSSAIWGDNIDDGLPPSLPPHELYYGEYDTSPYPTSSGMYGMDYDERVEAPHRSRNLETEPPSILVENLRHLQEINDGIHYLRHKDMERLQERSDDTGRLSNSCPDLAQNSAPHSEDLPEMYKPPVMPRNRRALPLGISEEQLVDELLSSGGDYQPTATSPINKEYHSRVMGRQTTQVACDSGEPSPGPLNRRHSWHSSEDLVTSPVDKRRFNDEEKQGSETDPQVVASPTVLRRAAHKDMTMFSLVVPSTAPGQGAAVSEGHISTRSKSLTGNTEDQLSTSETSAADRRYTISEGLVPDPSNFKQEEENGAQPPPLPPRPELPPAKKIVTRKLSFLSKVRNSARIKAKEKGKFNFSDLKLGHSKLSEEDTFDNSDTNKESTKNKFKRPSVIHRPASMMINRPPQYPVGTPPNGFNSHGKSRPTSTVGGLPYNNLVADPLIGMKRSSYHEEEDGMTYFASMKDRLSGSYESLEEGAIDTRDIESDLDLQIKNDEAESWSSTLDKKTLKKLSLSKKDLKRQENIFEFIQTERNYLITLKIMQLLYARGLAKELHMDQTTINKLFPLIDEHVEFVSKFVQRLTERQNANKVVSGIGDILVWQWGGENGATMKKLFGDFCSKQHEITAFYKDLLKSDKKFQTFMRKCEKNPLARRQDVQACCLLLTQRITKYPIMLNTLIDNSNKKDQKDDYSSLERALDLSKEIAKDVDEQVQAHEREQLLLEIYDKIESRSNTHYKDDRKFDRKDLLKRNRKLLYSSNSVQWNIKDTKKFTEVYFLLLTDCIVFLQENNGKYTFPSGQPSVVPLQKMIVREVANDEKGLYLMSMSSQQMYTLKLDSADACKTLTHTIRLAIGKCPEEEDDGNTSEDEGEKQLHERRLDRAKQVITQLELTDQRINRMLTEKMHLFKGLAESVERGNAVANLHFSFPYYSTDEAGNHYRMPPGTPILFKAIEQVHKLTHAFYGPGGLSRHPSSVGEHESSTRSTLSLPKRSDTFGGFDNDKDNSSSRAKWLNSSQSDSKLSDLEQEKLDSEPSNRDSGLIDSEVLGQQSDSQASIPKAWEPSTETSSGITSTDESSSNSQVYLPPTTDQVAALTTLAQLLSEYQSFAAQQDTLVEKLQLQLVSHDRTLGRKRAGGGLQEAELKRNQIKQQEQMDDLRKQQQQLRTEREQWQKQYERFQRSLDNDKEEFEKEKSKLVHEKEEIERQKQENHKMKDEYQQELQRLRVLQKKTQYDLHTSSSTTSLPASNKNNSNNYLDTPDFKPDILKPSGSKPQFSFQGSSMDVRNHKAPPSPTYPASEYPRTFPGPKREPFSSSSSTSQLPIHLQFSATNQLTNSQALKHQDINNSKVSKLASSKHSSKPSGGGEKGGLHQIIPGKLTKLGQPSSSSFTEQLKNVASLGNPRRKHAASDPVMSRLQVPPQKHTGRLSPPNMFTITPPASLSGSSIERTSSASSSSSKEGEKGGRANTGNHFKGFKSKHDEEELFL